MELMLILLLAVSLLTFLGPFLFKHPHTLIYMYAFSLVFEGYIIISQGFLTLNKAIIILLILLLVLDLHRRDYKIKYPGNISFKILALFKIIQVPLLFLNLSNIQAAMLNLMSDFQIPIFIILVYDYIDTKKKLDYLIRLFVFSITLASLIIVIVNAQSFFDPITGRLSFNSNENDLAFIVGMSLISILFLYKRYSRLEKAFYAFSFPLQLYILAMTGSRGTMISLVGAIVISIFLNANSLISKIKSAFTAIGVVGILFTIYMLEWIPQINEMFAKRLDDTYSEGMSGRDDFWVQYLADFLDHPFGMGLGYTFRLNIYGNHGAHNDFVKLFVEYGVLGISFYLLFFFWLFREIYSKMSLTSDTLYLLQLLLFIVIAGFTNDTFLFKAFGLVLAIIYSANNINLRNEDSEKDSFVYGVPR